MDSIINNKLISNIKIAAESIRIALVFFVRIKSLACKIRLPEIKIVPPKSRIPCQSNRGSACRFFKINDKPDNANSKQHKTY